APKAPKKTADGLKPMDRDASIERTRHCVLESRQKSRTCCGISHRRGKERERKNLYANQTSGCSLREFHPDVQLKLLIATIRIRNLKLEAFAIRQSITDASNHRSRSPPRPLPSSAYVAGGFPAAK